MNTGLQLVVDDFEALQLQTVDGDGRLHNTFADFFLQRTSSLRLSGTGT